MRILRLLYLVYVVIYSEYIYFIEQIYSKYPRTRCLDKEKKQSKPPHWQMNRQWLLSIFLCPQYELERIHFHQSKFTQLMKNAGRENGVFWGEEGKLLGFFCRNVTNSWVCVDKKNTHDTQRHKESCLSPCWATGFYLKGFADERLRIHEVSPQEHTIGLQWPATRMREPRMRGSCLSCVLAHLEVQPSREGQVSPLPSNMGRNAKWHFFPVADRLLYETWGDFSEKEERRADEEDHSSQLFVLAQRCLGRLGGQGCRHALPQDACGCSAVSNVGSSRAAVGQGRGGAGRACTARSPPSLCIPVTSSAGWSGGPRTSAEFSTIPRIPSGFSCVSFDRRKNCVFLSNLLS